MKLYAPNQEQAIPLKQWYTTTGETVRDSKAYFGTIQKNGDYWKGKTGWKK